MAKNKKIGLALGGGAARGLAHIGVLEVLEKASVPIDLIAGTSAGALIGALYASGIAAADIKKHMLSFDWAHRATLMDLSLRRNGLIGGKKIMDEFVRLTGEKKKFRELRIPLACVACDIVSGEEVVMTGGSLADAVRASISIPIVFAAVERKGRYLVDGGLADQVPVNVARAMGADVVIAVNVLPRRIRKVRPKLTEEKPLAADEKRPGMFQILMNTVDIFNSYHVESSLKGADFVIEPDTTGIAPSAFHQAGKCILQGELAASDALPALRRLLENV